MKNSSPSSVEMVQSYLRHGPTQVQTTPLHPYIFCAYIYRGLWSGVQRIF